MIGKAISYGAISIINGIATGIGGAVGINLETEALVKLSNEPGVIKTHIKNAQDENGELIRICVQKVLEACRVSDMYGVNICTQSDIPIARGLKSSSAAANAAVLATYAALQQIPPLNDNLILNMGVDAALEAKVSITGAFDDAYACYFGGSVITNNLERKIVKIPEINCPKQLKVVLRIPSQVIKTQDSGSEGLREFKTFFDVAIQESLKGSIFTAMMINGLLCASYYELESDFLTDMIKNGAITAGVSGTGPTMFAIVKEERLNKIVKQVKNYGDEVKVVNLNFKKAHAWRPSDEKHS